MDHTFAQSVHFYDTYFKPLSKSSGPSNSERYIVLSDTLNRNCFLQECFALVDSRNELIIMFIEIF